MDERLVPAALMADLGVRLCAVDPADGLLRRRERGEREIVRPRIHDVMVHSGGDVNDDDLNPGLIALNARPTPLGA